MNSLVKDKYLIWTAIGVVVCVVSLGIAIGIGNDFNDDNFVRLIVFLCCNVFGWLIYLFFQSFIFDAYQIYRMKFGKKESACEIQRVNQRYIVINNNYVTECNRHNRFHKNRHRKNLSPQVNLSRFILMHSVTQTAGLTMPTVKSRKRRNASVPLWSTFTIICPVLQTSRP